MRRLANLLLAALLVGTVANTRAETKPPPKPAIVLNRTDAARYAEPLGKTPLFVLVIGSDVREGNPTSGRSDSMHIIGLNTRTGHGTIVGIPRDSYVPIPGHGTNKINAALDFGGPGLLMQTITALSGIKFQYWAIVDFSRFRKLVDALGGLDINVKYPMHDFFSEVDLNPGRRHLDGHQALAFARTRKILPQGDFDRSFNQGRLLLASLQKFRKEASSPVRLFEYFRQFRSFVQSNVPPGELLHLANIGRRADPARISNVVLPGRGGSAGGASVVFLSGGINDLFRKVRDDGVL